LGVQHPKEVLVGEGGGSGWTSFFKTKETRTKEEDDFFHQNVDDFRDA